MAQQPNENQPQWQGKMFYWLCSHFRFFIPSDTMNNRIIFKVIKKLHITLNKWKKEFHEGQYWPLLGNRDMVWRKALLQPPTALPSSITEMYTSHF